ncbi:MAG TPA: GvpL/GvpF family gas vesicle protein [Solirubrobacteraceae bacterium]|nr:GvpL/GvpF family gas vesicle protein [Solirubrobacteraceae bacterium]
MRNGDELHIELRRLLAGQAVDVAGLVARARDEAEARVRALLVQAYTDVLLEQVQSELAADPVREVLPATPAADPDPDVLPATPAADPDPDVPPATPAADPGRDVLPATPAMHAERPGPAASDDPAPASGELACYVYCVVGQEHDAVPENLAGIDPDHHVFALEQGDLAAIVSRVPLAEFGEQPLREHLSDMSWLEKTARRHEHVLDELARGGTPIPMRLCSIYRDETGVRTMLDRESDALRDALAHLHGKAEWGVKAFADLDTVESAPAESSELGSGHGAAYMHGRLTERRRREEARARVDEGCDAMHAALCTIAVEGVTSAPQRPEVSGRDEPMVFNASYLVADQDMDAFHGELDRLRGELAPLGVELDVTGPWPPYNFVPGAIGAAW